MRRVIAKTCFSVRRVAARETRANALSCAQSRAVHDIRSTGPCDIRHQAGGSTGRRVAGVTDHLIKRPAGNRLHAAVVFHIQCQIAGTTAARTWMTTHPTASRRLSRATCIPGSHSTNEQTSHLAAIHTPMSTCYRTAMPTLDSTGDMAHITVGTPIRPQAMYAA